MAQRYHFCFALLTTVQWLYSSVLHDLACQPKNISSQLDSSQPHVLSHYSSEAVYCHYQTSYFLPYQGEQVGCYTQD